MSTETSERARDAESDRNSNDGRDADAGPDDRPPSTEDAPAPTDGELVVAVYPRAVHERLRSELDAERDRPCREYERAYADLLAERERLAREVETLERRLGRTEDRIDEVVARYERILAARTGSDRRAADEDTDRESTDRRPANGPLDRLQRWLR